MKNSNKNSTLLYILGYLKPYRLAVILTLVAVIISQVAATLEPFYLKKIIDYITTNSGKVFALSGAIVALLIYYFTLRVITFIFEFLRDYIFAPVEMGVGKNLAQDVFDHLLALPISFHYDQKTGALARRISRGAQSINFILDFLVINILPTLFELIFVTVLLLRLYPARYGLITFGTIVVYALFTLFTTEKRQKYRLAANIAEDESSAVQVETISNIDTIKYFGNEKHEEVRFADRIKKWYELSVRSNQLFAAISSGQSLILVVGFGLILYYAVLASLRGTLTIGDLVLLTSYVVRLAAPIGTLGFVYRRIKDGLTDLSSMVTLFSQEEDMLRQRSHEIIARPKGEIKFCDVTFSYGKREALHGLTLDIPAGKRVAIVGPSGAGKSTIVKLLFRLFYPRSGRVLVDGHLIQNIDTEQFYSLIALVPQEPTLFNGMIAENVRFGKPDASQAEIERAVKLANLDGLIKRLPDGYETIVGERGVKLSGGEKQRVAIARAIIKDPKILVFDEATSNLDAESEQEILQSIRDVSKGRTTVSIAHRLPTIVDSDIIYVIDKGHLAEQGTHTELLKKNGLYASLWKRFVK